jgi:hypothetical protein
MKTTVFSPIRSSFKRIPSGGMVPVFLVVALILSPFRVSADDDPCRETGIYILNQTQLGSWFTRNGGPCTIWQRNYLITVKPEDTLIIYSDNECKAEYYSNNPTYHDYKSVDANQDCRVRILPDRTLKDL